MSDGPLEDGGDRDSFLELGSRVPLPAVEDSVRSSGPGKSAEERLKAVGKSKWWHFVLLAALVIGGGALFVFLFSGMPLARGDDLFKWLSEYYDYSFYAGGAAVFVTLLLIVLDVRFWSGAWQYFALLLLVTAAALYGAAAVLAVKEFYVVPIGYFLLGAPFFLMFLRATIFRSMDIIHFLWTLCASLMVQAMAVGSIWAAWLIVERKWWTVETKAEFYVRMGCNTTSIPQTYLEDPSLITDLDAFERANLDEQLVGCTQAFLLWLSPCILGLWSFVFAVVLFFLVRMLADARAERNGAKALDSIAQAFIMAVGLGLFGMWAAAGLAGAEMNLTNVILSLGFVAMVVTGVVVVSVFGAAAMQDGLASTALGTKVMDAMGSDWAKAILLMLISPLFLLYLCVALLTQCSRRTLGCSKTLEDEEKRMLFTARATKYIERVKRWNWTSVLVKCHWLGILFFLLSVGVVRLTTLFLSWLNDQLSSLSLPVTTVIFLAVGIAMFLNPFIPGVPVYLSGGIILVNSAEPTLGFWGGVVFTMGICFFLKLSAIVMQQKLIGEMWAGRKVWIRKMVGVNSIDIRAIRFILTKPGMDIKKVSILCGGPDWPVSVLTGILRLNLCSMLLASTPVFFLIAPTVVAGAMLLRAAEGGIWGSLSTLTMAFTVVIQSAAMLAAIHYIAAAVIKNQAELDKIPLDQEVLDLERKERKRNRLQVHISHWKRINAFMRVLLALSATMMAASCYLFQLLGSRCFVPFEVSDSIQVQLEGNAINLVLPLGWVGLGVFAAPCVLLFIFNRYVAHLMRNELRRNPKCIIEGEPDEDRDEEPDQDDEQEEHVDPKDRSTGTICSSLFCICR